MRNSPRSLLLAFIKLHTAVLSLHPYDSVTSYCNTLVIIDFGLRLELSTTVWAFTTFNLMVCCCLPTPYWQAPLTFRSVFVCWWTCRRGIMTFSLIWTALSFTNILLLQGVINNRVIEQRNEVGSTSVYEIFFIRTPLRPKAGANYKGAALLLRITNFTQTCTHTYTHALMRSWFENQRLLISLVYRSLQLCSLEISLYK